MKCPNCSRSVPFGSTACPMCGRPLVADASGAAWDASTEFGSARGSTLGSEWESTGRSSGTGKPVEDASTGPGPQSPMPPFGGQQQSTSVVHRIVRAVQLFIVAVVAINVLRAYLDVGS